MDFEQLYSLLPKPSITWTVSDIEIWLQFIGLSAYASQFRTSAIIRIGVSRWQLSVSANRRRHPQLTKDYIEDNNQKNHDMYLMCHLGVKLGIQRFDQYLMDRQKSLKQTSMSKKISQRAEIKTREANLQKSQRIREIQKWQPMPSMSEGSAQRRVKRETTELEGEKRELNELVIKQCQSSMYSCYSLKEHGGMIGRNSKNQIHIVDQNVSRFHAQIDYQRGKYLIRDCGSSSGTFIRISQKTELKHGQILQMGSNQFIVDLSNQKSVALKVIEGPNIGQTFVQSALKGKSNVGRKNTNQISFPQDQHLSNIHSTVFAIEGVWYIEDLGTTNGTWIRLSPQGIKSECYPLQNGTQFKLGSSLTYECQLNQNNRKTEKQKSDKCQLCKISQRDCIFLPCKHNVACYKCTQNNQMSHCVSCASEIRQVMKIFKV